MEMLRQKNTATIIMFPIVDADGDVVTGATGLDSEYTYWADGTNPIAFADLTVEATEVGTNGIYYLALSAAEMNHDYVYVQIKTTTAGAKTQHIIIRTINADPLVTVTAVAGAGAITFTYTLTKAVSGDPIPDADVWVSTDVDGTDIVAGRLQTNALGVVVFYLDAGTYYVWRQKSGINFTNPDTEVVS